MEITIRNMPKKQPEKEKNGTNMSGRPELMLAQFSLHNYNNRKNVLQLKLNRID